MTGKAAQDNGNEVVGGWVGGRRRLDHPTTAREVMQAWAFHVLGRVIGGLLLTCQCDGSLRPLPSLGYKVGRRGLGCSCVLARSAPSVLRLAWVRSFAKVGNGVVFVMRGVARQLSGVEGMLCSV